MINEYRYCLVKDHDNANCQLICTFRDCNQGSRWACTKCVLQQIHQHNQTSNDHIMDQQQFKLLISQHILNENQDKKSQLEKIQQYIQQINKLVELVRQLKEFLKIFQKEIDDNNQSIKIQKLVQNDFYSLKSDDISQVLSFQNQKQTQINNQQYLTIVQHITSQSQKIEQSILQKEDNQQIQEISQSMDFKNYARLRQNNLIQTAQVSQNELYLVFGGWEKQLILYYLDLNKEIKQIQLDYEIHICRFSENSNLIYVGCGNGYLYCIDIAKNYEQIYKKQLHQARICNIIEYQHKIIITSHQSDIIITNIRLQQQILKIDNAHSNWIFGLYQLNDVIVSGSFDKSLKFFNLASGSFLFEKKQAHDDKIQKIQLMNDNQLLSLSCDGILKLWQVDYQNNKLNFQQEYQNEIQNFDYINQEQIILICKKYFQLLNKEFELLKQIDHFQNQDVRFVMTNQLKTINYVLINGANQFTVMKRIQEKQ